MKKCGVAVLTAVLSVGACAQTNAPTDSTQNAAKPVAAKALVATKPQVGTPAARAREALRTIDPHIEVERIGNAPLPGFQQAIIGGQVVYVSNDGKYLMQGALFDIGAKQNLSDVAMSEVRRELLKAIPLKDRIVFAPAAPKYTVAVFTDVECGYCRKLHSEVGEFNKQGIAIEYLAFPRMGSGSPDFAKMEAVWCSADRKKALTDAKNDKPVPARRCTNPVAMQYAYGQRMGLTGTPMILSEDGMQLGGYLSPVQLREVLDKRANKAAPSKPPGA